MSKASWGDALWELGLIWKLESGISDVSNLTLDSNLSRTSVHMTNIPLPFDCAAIIKFNYEHRYDHLNFDEENQQFVCHANAVVKLLLPNGVGFLIVTQYLFIKRKDWQFNECSLVSGYLGILKTV